jgi:hypothetical protein
MADRRINKTVDLQETKFLRLFRLTMCMFKRLNITAYISVYRSISITPIWHEVHPIILCCQIKYLLLCRYVITTLWHDALDFYYT